MGRSNKSRKALATRGAPGIKLLKGVGWFLGALATIGGLWQLIDGLRPLDPVITAGLPGNTAQPFTIPFSIYNPNRFYRFRNVSSLCAIPVKEEQAPQALKDRGYDLGIAFELAHSTKVMLPGESYIMSCSLRYESPINSDVQANLSISYYLALWPWSDRITASVWPWKNGIISNPTKFTWQANADPPRWTTGERL